MKKCKDAGVTIIMITGDDSTTASAIGANIGIVSDDPVVITQVANGMVCRTAREAVHGIGFFTNRLLLLGIAVEILPQIFIVYHPLGNAILNTAPIDISDWMILLPFAVLLFVAEEARKAVVRVVGRE